MAEEPMLAPLGWVRDQAINSCRVLAGCDGDTMNTLQFSQIIVA